MIERKVDDSFRGEYLRQYPVTSVLQPTQEFFSLTASVAQDTQSTLSAPTKRNGASSVHASSSNPVQAGAAELSPQPHNDKKSIKDDTVTRWAKEQGRIHEWRIEMKRDHALRELREEHASTDGGDPTLRANQVDLSAKGPKSGRELASTERSTTVLIQTLLGDQVSQPERELWGSLNDGLLPEMTETFGAGIESK
ncbi:hypothetical protein BC939DRAFT_531467 [Gamsiella multidivaricata]|uniref:uncharacterized protein n=1 Tax=Gamsiella multidivaricata TaxID=101098 RepID=UPI0022211E13|nr:uncharacterized protein BC939DRAFT_531467 [Gamsiella multidivaricata]KAI7819133.1 hypothetical protein BC939DRAFT_531467 [Gamsiella multidivaricata]